jgi:hypothetical protein
LKWNQSIIISIRAPGPVRHSNPNHPSIDPDSQNLPPSFFMIEFWKQAQVSQQIATSFPSMIEPPLLSIQHQLGISQEHENKSFSNLQYAPGCTSQNSSSAFARIHGLPSIQPTNNKQQSKFQT